MTIFTQKNKTALPKQKRKLPFNQWQGYLGQGNTDDLMKELQ